MQQVTGRLTKDAIVKTLDSGKQVVNFSIADNESYKPKGKDEAVQVTTFFNCAYWLNPSVAKVLRKGAVVQLNGRVSARPYQSNTGDMAASLEFHTSRIEVLAYAARENEAGGTPLKKEEQGKGRKQNKNKGDDDDLPF